MKVIGITGPSGSGKSKISSVLREQGYPVIDADIIAKELRPKFVNDVVRLFGPQYVKDNVVDAKKLALLVFNDRSELHKLNDLMFPAIIAEMERRIEEYRKQDIEFVFCDIAVLFTSGAERFIDYIILVTASRLTRMERLINFRKIDPVIAISQVDSVFITHDELNRCDLILINENNDEEELKLKIFEWLHSLKEGTAHVRENRPIEINQL